MTMYVAFFCEAYMKPIANAFAFTHTFAAHAVVLSKPSAISSADSTFPC